MLKNGFPRQLQFQFLELLLEATATGLKPPQRLGDHLLESVFRQVQPQRLQDARHDRSPPRSRCGLVGAAGLAGFRRTSQRSFRFVVRSADRHGPAVGLDRRGSGHEGEQSLVVLQTHDLVGEQDVIVLQPAARFRKHLPIAQEGQFLFECGHLGKFTRVVEFGVGLDGPGVVVDLQQSVGEEAVAALLAVLERQLDRLANQVRPALLHLGEAGVHRRVVAEQNPLEDVGVEDAFEGFGILVDAEQEQPRLLRQKRPDALETPTGLVGVDDRRVGDQRA